MSVIGNIHKRFNTFMGHYFPKTMISLFYWRMTGERLDWSSPQDIDAKIGWLKIYGDTSMWPLCADKYRVREYIKEKGLGDMLIPLYGKWDRAEDIDWDSLPSEFVLKTNHASGDAFICRDKSKLNRSEVTQFFRKTLEKKYGYDKAELHYAKIKPCVIAEKLMPVEEQNYPSTSLIDYKIWCFDGKPEYILAVYNRQGHSCVLGVYDKEWNFHPEFSHSAPHYVLAKEPITRPGTLDRMLQAASILSKGFPELRADFYEIGGRTYFGEMTFTSSSGQHDYYTKEFKTILGNFVTLPKKRKR